MTTSTESRATVIEGSLREVALADVLQLLDLGRKTGLLCVDDARSERAARIIVVSGRVCGATLADRAVPNEAVSVRDAIAADARTVFDVVGEALAWTSGRFTVHALDESLSGTIGSGHGVDVLLMDAARRADEWTSLSDRVAGPHTVPMLAESDSGAHVALTPDEWEVLAYADGAADLSAIAHRVARDVLAVAASVHRLIGLGLLIEAPDVGDAVPRDAGRSSEV